MTDTLINEKQLQAEIDALKRQFPDTQDAYREACVLLFFRYGITPTANKLYQYVRKGSMSAPAEALNKFWSELRDKSRVRIERTDIPENIGTTAGEFVAKLWADAQKAAQDGFSDLIDNAAAKILQFKMQCEVAKQETVKIEHLLRETQTKQEGALKLVSESESLRLLDTLALVDKEKSLKALENECEHLKAALIASREGFGAEITKISNLMNKSEERFKSHESKYLIEIDGQRQKSRLLQKELVQLSSLFKSEQAAYIKEIANLNKTNSLLNNRIGLQEGQIESLKFYRAELTKQLKSAEKKLQKTNQKKH